jgi:chemotaxis protein MotB
MAGIRRRREGNGLEAWPGYVDALSTLLMVIIFALLVFVLAQGFLSIALSGRDRALDQVNRQLAELSDMLALERGRAEELRLSLAQLSRDLLAATDSRDALARELAVSREGAAALSAERDTLRAERDRLAQRLADVTAEAQTTAARMGQLQSRLAEATRQSDAVSEEAAATLAQLADARRALAEQVRALAALRDELERKAQDAAARAMSEEERRAAVEKELAEERRLSESARAQLALFNAQVTELRAQMAALARALEIAEAAGRDKDAQIANLGSRLNAALAARVEELQRYRSDFFGRLRDVLAGRPGIQVVGDRFVFQSEVLFPVGSAALTPAGQEQITALAETIRQISAEIPANIPWVLRVDGHADRQPLSGRSGYATNWELSAARAITVVKQLIADGVPPERLAATGFADYQPIDPAATPEAYARNRRIELRLTDR